VLIIGHDPGVSGAFVVIDEDRNLHGWALVPTYKDKTRNRVDVSQVISWLRPFALEGAILVTERVGPRPGDTPTTAWTFGAAEASVLAAAEALGLPVHYVAPQKWQAAVLVGLPRKGRESIKRSAVLWARDSMPGLRDCLRTKKNSGVADAACIAELGRRKWRGGIL
jgi:hypothetical protein